MEFSVVQKITLEQVENLLISAFEGGSNYWYMIERNIKPKKWIYNEEPGKPRYYEYALNPGGAIIITDLEDEDKPKKEYRLNLESIQKGLKIMASLKQGEGGHHWPNLLNDNADSETGDVFLQCCLFGEIIYG